MKNRYSHINRMSFSFSFYYYALVYMISFLYLSVIYADIIYVDVKSNEPKIEQKCGKSISTRCKTISGALRRAKDGDTIFIFPGIYFGSKNNNLCSPTSITNTSSIDSLNFTSFNVTCPKNLTFFGNNSHPGDVVINGNYSTNIRGVYALDATYNFSQITFSDFYINESIPTISSLNGIDVGVGAAIFGVGSKITLNNVIFKNNQAKQGGALAALLGSTVIVHQSSFTGNQATDSGGAIVIESSILHMHSSSLWLNSVRKVPHSTTTSFYGGGGALLLMNPLDVLADNCQFYNNSSPRSGGALHMMTSSAPTVSFIIGNSSFNHNKVIVEADCQGSVVACVADGGALYIDSDFAGVIDGCTFEGNSVNSKLAIPTANGGAIYLTSSKTVSNALFSIRQSKFQANTAVTSGGALYVNGLSFSLESTSFNANVVGEFIQLFTYAPAVGGALWFSDIQSVVSSVVRDCTFSENIAVGGNGGGIYLISQTKPVLISNTVFERNKVFSIYNFAGQGGAMAMARLSLASLSNCMFLSNMAAPIPGTSASSGSAGAIFVQSAFVNILSCTFESNLATAGQFDAGAQGGALLFENVVQSVIADSVFSQNAASGYSTAPQYTSSGTGGAIGLHLAVVTISGCQFVRNWVSTGIFQAGTGGAISVYNLDQTTATALGPIMISRSNFSENAAFASLCDTANADGGNGGAIALIGLNEQRVVMSDVNFYSNFAMGKFGRGIVSLSTTSYSLGGAVLVTGGSVLLATRCNFSDNLAADGFGNDIVLVKSGSASAYADNSLNISSFRLSEVYSTSQNSALLTVATDLAVTACSTAKGFLKMSISSSVPFTASAKVVAGWESRNRGRRLSPTSIPILPNVPEFLITTSFSLLVLSGSATLIDLQSLSGSTHVGAFSVGDTSRSDISTYASQNLTFGGDMSQLQLLAISVFSSRLTLSPAVDGDGDREVTLRGLNMINSTLVISNNVTLIGDCVLINSAIIGDSSKRLHRESGYPVVRFVGKVTTGITLQVARTLFPALNSTGGKDLILEKFFLSKPLLSLTNCIAEVFSEMLLDRSLLLNYKSFLPTIAVHLIGEALLRIMPGGILRICDSTIIRNENKVLVSFENLGTIYLDPSQTSDHPNFLPPAVTNQPDFSSLGSAYSTLRLDCVASQSYDGSIVVYLGSDNFNHAIVHLFTNKSFTGTIKVNLANNTHLALPGYGGIYNSNWTLVKVDSVYSRDPDSLVSNAPSLLPTVRPVTVISRPPFLSFSPFQPLRPSKGVPTSADTSIPTSSGPTLSPVRSIFSSTGPTSFPAVQVSSLSQSQTNFVTASMSIDSSISEKWSNKEDIFATSSATVVKLNVTSNALFELIIKSEIPGVSFKTGMVVTSLPHIQSNHSYLNISSSIPHIRSRLFLDTHNSNILVSANITRSNSTHDMFNRSVTSAVMTLQVSGMSCTQLSTFYDSSATNSAQEMCTTCSTNSSCSYCGQGICAESGQCPAGSSAWSSCCAGGTCGSHGTCVGGAKDGYSCQCSFFYQLKSSQVSTNTDNGTPNTCSVLSTDGIAIIVSILAALVIACLSCLYYYYYRGKRRQFFDDLRDEVLGESEDISRFARTMSTSVPQGFIQNLQESLLLKEIFEDYNAFKIICKIGEGSFGVVLKAEYRSSYVAMKQIHAPIVGEISPSDMKQFKSEALILRNLTNPNIVSLMKISVRTIVNPARSPDEKPTPVQTICMISEYLELGSLADLLYGPRPVSIDSWNYLLLLDCASQAASGIRYLHTNKPAICHRDLKGSNLVVDSKWTVKVTDFGMSRFIPDQTKQQGVNVSTPSVAPKSSKFFNSFYGSSLDTSSKSSESASPPPTSISASTDNNMISPEMTSNLGTTAWCAPELLVTESAVSYSLKVDVYSFGMVLWEMWERKRPFHDVVSKFEIIERIRNGNRPPLNNACPLFLVDLINRCCHMDPEQRPNFNYIVKVLREELEREKRRSARSLSDTSFTSIGSVLFGPGNEANSARLLTGPRSSDEYNDDFVLSAESPNKTTPYILFPEETISPIHNDSLAAGSLSSDTNSNPRWTKWRDGFVHRSLSSIPNSERVLPASIRNDSARNMQPLPEIPDREIPSDDNTEDIIDDDDYNTYDITE